MNFKIFEHSVEQTQLSSGATLINVCVPHIPVSIIGATLHAGARFDPIGKEGLAHFFEHLYMIKTKKYPDRYQRLEALESQGIFYNAITSPELVVYRYDQPSEKTYEALHFLLDGLNQTIINPSDVDHEKNVIQDEESRRRNDPNGHIWTIAYQTMWSSFTLGRPLLGTQQSIKAISFEDIQSFKNKLYASDNTVFIVVNNEPTEKIKECINKEYSSKKSLPSPLVKTKIYPKPKRIYVEQRNLDKIAVSIAFKTTGNDSYPDWVILEFMKDYFSNGWISKLIKRLRIENNFTYWVQSSNRNYWDTGIIQFVFSTAKERLNEALKAALEEIKSLKNKLLPEKELTAHKNFSIADFTKSLLRPERFLHWYSSEKILSTDPIDIQTYIQKTKAITPHQLQEVAQKYLTQENLSITMIGPISESDIAIPEF